MSGGSGYRPFDFRKPRQGAPAVPRPLAQWQERICALAGEAWNKHLASPVKWACQQNESMRFADAVSRIPDPGIGASVAVSESQFGTYWTMAQSHVLSLIADMLGNVADKLPEPRPLTAIEESLVHLLISELAWAMGEAWPGRQSLSCRPVDIERRAARTRIFAPQEEVIVSRFVLSSRLGDTACLWLIPQEPIQQLLSAEWPDTPDVADARGAAPHVERLAAALPVTLTARLGTAQLPMAQLADLQIGDVIVLDQFISDPVAVDVHGTRKFRGYPGRIGLQRSLQIEEVLETVSDPPPEFSHA